MTKLNYAKAKHHHLPRTLDKNRRATCTLVKYCGIENNNDKVWKMGEAYKEQSDSTANG